HGLIDMPINISRRAERRRISVEQVNLLRSSRGLTQDGIERLPEPSLQRAVRRLDYPDAPRARLAFRLAQSRDDEGRLPSQPMVTALRQLDGLRLRARRANVAGMPTGGAGPPPDLGGAVSPGAALRPPEGGGPRPAEVGGPRPGQHRRANTLAPHSSGQSPDHVGWKRGRWHLAYR